MSKSSIRQRYREWARDIVEHADAAERRALAAWARRLLEIRESDQPPPVKIQQAYQASADLKVSGKLIGLLGSEFRRLGWDERDTLERTGIAAAATLALLTSFGMVALAAIGGTMSAPLWIVFGPGAEFAEILAQVAEAGHEQEQEQDEHAPGDGFAAAEHAEPVPAEASAPEAAVQDVGAQPAGAAEDARIAEPAVLIRLAGRLGEALTEDELYEATRGVWRVAEAKRARLEYAFAIAGQTVREVYRIDAWHEAGTTPYRTRTEEEVRVAGRWEFTGTRAPDALRSKYLGRSVAEQFKSANPNPIRYVNV